ncbi:hypothetical protein DFH06DRAFT_1122944 [Mycena polygramma]|nr:hypothetical protein DFH06DRAFT_1122944 [Mycena polygramma]
MAASSSVPLLVKTEPTEDDISSVTDFFEPFRIPVGRRLLQLFDKGHLARLTPPELLEIFEGARPCFFTDPSDEAENFFRSVFFIAKFLVRNLVLDGADVLWLNDFCNPDAEKCLRAQRPLQNPPAWTNSKNFPLPPLNFGDFSGYDSDIQETDKFGWYSPEGKPKEKPKLLPPSNSDEMPVDNSLPPPHVAAETFSIPQLPPPPSPSHLDVLMTNVIESSVSPALLSPR